MPHAVAPDLGQGHLDAALFAGDSLVLHALILAAQALVILDGTKDASTEQAVAFRFKGPVVDRFGFLDLAKRPRADAFRARDGDTKLVEARGAADLAKNLHQFVHWVISFTDFTAGDWL